MLYVPTFTQKDFHYVHIRPSTKGPSPRNYNSTLEIHYFSLNHNNLYTRGTRHKAKPQSPLHKRDEAQSQNSTISPLLKRDRHKAKTQSQSPLHKRDRHKTKTQSPLHKRDRHKAKAQTQSPLHKRDKAQSQTTITSTQEG